MLAVGSGVVWFFFLPDLCGNDEVREVVSPDGKFKAVKFRRSCGATTGYSTHVSILPASRQIPNKAGNILVVEDEPTIAIRWIDDRHLAISKGEAKTTFLQLPAFQGIQITYE